MSERLNGFSDSAGFQELPMRQHVVGTQQPLFFFLMRKCKSKVVQYECIKAYCNMAAMAILISHICLYKALFGYIKEVEANF